MRYLDRLLQEWRAREARPWIPSGGKRPMTRSNDKPIHLTKPPVTPVTLLRSGQGHASLPEPISRVPTEEADRVELSTESLPLKRYEETARRLLILVALYAIPAIVVMHPVDDYDIWWHLRTG